MTYACPTCDLPALPATPRQALVRGGALGVLISGICMLMYMCICMLMCIYTRCGYIYEALPPVGVLISGSSSNEPHARPSLLWGCSSAAAAVTSTH